MKKTANVLEERADASGNNVATKKLAKNVSECLAKVNSLTSSARTINSLFCPQALTLRMRLRDMCERAFFSDPNSQKQHLEEILWRKVYYEPLSTAKRLRKDNSWSASEIGWIWAHLNDGIAYYQQLLLSVASNLEEEKADFLLRKFHENDVSLSTKDSKSAPVYKELFFRSLTCLGDLTRYLLDIPTQISHDRTYLLCVRYYHQALHYNKDGGLTHSNLATVYSNNNQPLLATLHYLRALTCEKPFVAAESNLKRMLDKSRLWIENEKLERSEEADSEGKEKNKSPSLKEEPKLKKESLKFLHSSLTLVSFFINDKKTDDVSVLCQKVLVQLGRLLDNYDCDPPDVSESLTDGEEILMNGHITSFDPGGKNNKKNLIAELDSPFVLNPESLVALCAVFILCSKRLVNKDSAHGSMSEVLIVSILLTLVSHINTRLEQRFSLVDPSFIEKLIPKEEEEENNNCGKISPELKSPINKKEKVQIKKSFKANRLSKLRRKRRRDKDEEINGCTSDNSLDDDEEEGEPIVDEILSSSESEDGDDHLDNSILCSSEDDLDSDEDVKIESEQEWDGISALEHLQLVGQEGMLASVYVTLSWLSANKEIIKLSSKNAQNLWTSLAKLSNLIRIDYAQLAESGPIGFKKPFMEMLKWAKNNDAELANKEFAKVDESLSRFALPEEMMLHLAMESFGVGDPVDSGNLKNSEISLIRLLRLKKFMTSLAGMGETPIRMEESGMFTVAKEKTAEKEIANIAVKLEQNSSPSHHRSTSSPVHLNDLSKVTPGMRALTAQWLQHEVRNLEERTNRKTNLVGLYLVPDAAVLTDYLSNLKLILTNPSHMVIIPQSVIDSLDQKKRESVGARDAIRWLEVKLRHGSRFIRAQRQHERTHLPLIKYPKRKDKEACEWFQIAECCNYLGAQMHHHGAQPKSPTVVLLTGKSDKLSQLSFSAHTLAEAAGAKLQGVEDFVRKWQTSTKGHS